MYLHLDIEMTKEPFFASYDVDITFFRLFDWHFCCFRSIEKKGRVFTSGVGASLTWERTLSKSSCTPEWGQAWLERELLVKAPVFLSENKLELGEHSLELLYCCHCRQAASNVLTHLYQPVTGRRPASPLLPFRNCYFRPRRLWPRLLPLFLVENAKQRRHFSSTKPSFTSTYFYLHIHTSVLQISQSIQLFCTLLQLLSPSGDLGISLVWRNLSWPQLFGLTVEILFKLN